MIRNTTVLALTLALGLVACGEDDAATNNMKDNKTPGTNTMTMNTGMNTGTMMTMTNTMMTLTPKPDPGCDGSAEEPARCKEDPATKTDWSPASVISELKILSGTNCCQDFNGDGANDNALGSISILVNPANSAIEKAIADGSVAIVFEHEGLSDSSTDFDINVLQAEPSTAGTAPNAAGGTPYKVVPSSFAKGAYAKARITDATLEGTRVTGGPGNVALTISVLGITITLPLVQAQVAANVDLANSELTSGGKGVALNDGELSGVVGLEALKDELNRVASSQCGVCFKKDAAPFTEDLFVLAQDSDGTYSLTCTPGVTSDTCDANDTIQSACKQVAGLGCTSAGAVLVGAADVKLDDLGSVCKDDTINTCDAVSIATSFKAVGAKIDGVVAAP